MKRIMYLVYLTAFLSVGWSQTTGKLTGIVQGDDGSALVGANVIILGTGCAGLTAAIYTARANLKPLIIEGSQPGGQLTTTSEVENFPGFPEGIDGFMLMQQVRDQAKRFGTRFTNDIIESVDFSGEFKILNSSNATYKARTVIIATGASPRLLGVPGEQEMFGGKGVTTCATCDGAFYRDMDVVVVGGGGGWRARGTVDGSGRFLKCGRGRHWIRGGLRRRRCCCCRRRRRGGRRGWCWWMDEG